MKKKILLITPYYRADSFFGGPVTAINGHLKLFSKLNYQVIVLSGNCEKALSNKNILYYRNIFPSLASKFRFFFAPGVIYSFFKNRQNVNLIVFEETFVWTHIIVAFLANIFNLKYVVFPHGSLSLSDIRGNIFVKKLYFLLGGRLLFKNASLIICNSKSEQSEAVTTLKKLKILTKVINLPNYIELNSNSPSEALSIPFSDRYSLLFIGRLYRLKGVELLIIAFAKYKNANPSSKLKLLFIGQDAGSEAKIRQVITDNQLESSVKLLGHISRDAVFNELSKAKFLSLLSYSEGLPSVVLEAAALGIPVLLTKQTNLSSLITAGGGLETNHSLNQIVQNLSKIDNLTARKWIAMSQNAIKWYDKNYSFEVLVKKYYEHFNKLG